MLHRQSEKSATEGEETSASHVKIESKCDAYVTVPVSSGSSLTPQAALSEAEILCWSLNTYVPLSELERWEGFSLWEMPVQTFQTMAQLPTY